MKEIAIENMVAITISQTEPMMALINEWPVYLVRGGHVYMLVCPFCGRVVCSYTRKAGEGSATITGQLLEQLMECNPWEDDSGHGPHCGCTYVVNWGAYYKRPCEWNVWQHENNCPATITPRLLAAIRGPFTVTCPPDRETGKWQYEMHELNGMLEHVNVNRIAGELLDWLANAYYPGMDYHWCNRGVEYTCHVVDDMVRVVPYKNQMTGVMYNRSCDIARIKRYAAAVENAVADYYTEFIRR